MNEEFQHLRRSAKRLERYYCRIKENIWRGDRSSLITALAATAEAAEIARRLWLAIQQQLKNTSSAHFNPSSGIDPCPSGSLQERRSSQAPQAPSQVRLHELEGIVAEGLTAFLAVGRALSEIKEAALYREDYGSFEQYCIAGGV